MPQPGTPGINQNVRGASNVSLMFDINIVYYDVIRVFRLLCVLYYCAGQC